MVLMVASVWLSYLTVIHGRYSLLGGLELVSVVFVGFCAHEARGCI